MSVGGVEGGNVFFLIVLLRCVSLRELRSHCAVSQNAVYYSQQSKTLASNDGHLYNERRLGDVAHVAKWREWVPSNGGTF